MLAREVPTSYGEADLGSVAMIHSDLCAIINLGDSDLHLFDLNLKVEVTTIKSPHESHTFWNSVIPFGIDDKLHTKYLLLKGMRTLNLIEVQTGAIELLSESKLDMLGYNNTMSFNAIGEGTNRDISILSIENNTKIREIILKTSNF